MGNLPSAGLRFSNGFGYIFLSPGDFFFDIQRRGGYNFLQILERASAGKTSYLSFVFAFFVTGGCP